MFVGYQVNLRIPTFRYGLKYRQCFWSTQI